MFSYGVKYVKIEFILYILQTNINYYNFLLLHKKWRWNPNFILYTSPVTDASDRGG